MDRDAIAGLEAERDEAEPERARAGVVVGPGVLAPDPETLLAQRDMGRALAAALAERGRERLERRGNHPATAANSWPRHPRFTSESWRDPRSPPRDQNSGKGNYSLAPRLAPTGQQCRPDHAEPPRAPYNTHADAPR